MKSTQRILFIGLGWEQIDFARSLHEVGHQIFGLTGFSKDYFGDLVEEVRNIEPLNIPGILQAAKEWNVHAVVSDQCDYSRYAEETVAGVLGFQPAPTATANGVSKILQRQLAAQCKIPQPAFRVCHSALAAQEAFQNLGGDVMIKPSDARGSFGITHVRHLDAVKAAYYEARTNAVVSPILVEQFIPGELVTFDGVLVNGELQVKAIAQSHHDASNSVALQDHIYTKPSEFSLSSVGEKNLRSLCQTMGFTQGFVHSEWIRNGNELFFIELANRAPGIRAVSRIMSPLSGEDLYALAYPHLLPRTSLSAPCQFAIQTFHFGVRGQTKADFILEKLRHDPRLLDYEVWPQPTSPNLSFGRKVRLGHATFGGQDLNELIDLAETCGASR